MCNISRLFEDQLQEQRQIEGRVEQMPRNRIPTIQDMLALERELEDEILQVEEALRHFGANELMADTWHMLADMREEARTHLEQVRAYLDFVLQPDQ